MNYGLLNCPRNQEKHLFYNNKIDFNNLLKYEHEPNVQFLLGNIKFFGFANQVKDLINAFEYLKASGESGHTVGEHALGVMYHNGFGTEKNFKNAFTFYSSAASKGYSPSIFNLGQLYMYGLGVDKDELLGFEYYLSSAKKKNIVALHHVGCIYHEGILTEEDDNRAIYYLHNKVRMKNEVCSDLNNILNN